MPLGFKIPKIPARKLGAAIGVSPAPGRDALLVWKRVLAGLAIANVVVFFALVRPIGGSASDLAEELEQTRRQVRQGQIEITRLKKLVEKVGNARKQQNAFVKTYFMDRRTASSTILMEIQSAAGKAGLTPREHAFVIDPIEGSDTLSMMTITANYEGSYGNLVDFVNQIDKSARFLIIDNIQAAPQQQAGKLSARFKLNTFVRDDGSGQLIAQATAAQAAAAPGATQ
jgi:Tfp pilus assembly protein PilO